MNELEHRLNYAAQQRETQANDAAGWYAIAQIKTEELAEMQIRLDLAMNENTESFVKQKERIDFLEKQLIDFQLAASPAVPSP